MQAPALAFPNKNLADRQYRSPPRAYQLSLVARDLLTRTYQSYLRLCSLTYCYWYHGLLTTKYYYYFKSYFKYFLLDITAGTGHRRSSSVVLTLSLIHTIYRQIFSTSSESWT